MASAQLLPPDGCEENDICDMGGDPAKLVAVSPLAPFADTLNIDNPHNLDWIQCQCNRAARHRQHIDPANVR